jgi:hypothetical protein
MQQNIKIDTFAGGVLKEKFDQELTRVLENIADPNTKEDAIRKISLDIKFKPDTDREVALVEINSKATLAATKAVGTKILIDRDIENNKVFASEFGKNQLKGQVNINDFQNSENTENEIEEEKANDSSQVVDFRTKSN